MSSIVREIQLRYRLQVHFTEQAFALGNSLLQAVMREAGGPAPIRVLVTLDEALAAAQPALSGRIVDWFAARAGDLALVAPPLAIEGGERAKNSYFHVSEIQSHFDRHRLDRHAYVVAVGGGAHLDVVGLAAATAHRGMRHIRLPSTTLAQADSGVGVKNGINAFGKKNFIGTFAPPTAVINDFALLDSLPPRDKRAGYAEAVKVALIRDAGFFAALEQDADALRAFDPAALRRLIRRSAELHLDHIATGGDPFERGSARPLDFGHWAAHKLELLSDFKWRHGEAVALGVALDTLYSRRVGRLADADAARVLDLLRRLGFTLRADELLHRDPAGRLRLLAGLEEFREHLGGRLTVTLLEAIGRGVEVHRMEEAIVLAAIEELQGATPAPVG